MKKSIAVLLLAALVGACDPKPGTTTPAPATVSKAAKGVEITLDDVEVAHDVGTMGLVEPAPEGATYIHVTYTLKNTGTKPLTFIDRPQARLVDPKGNKLEPEILASTTLSSVANSSWIENVNPNLTSEAQLVWKVDEKSFDRAKWKLRFQTKPALDFPLQ